MIAVVVAPGTGLGGVVEDRLAALCGADHRVAIGQVAAQLVYAEPVEHRVQAAVEAHHFMPALHQAAAQRAAEETTAAGDEDLHRLLRSCLAAHAASFSRPILALWRMSTGKRGWKRKVSIRAACTKPSPRWRSSSAMRGRWSRSEEHTSELQSLMRISYAVFCLKKKQ